MHQRRTAIAIAAVLFTLLTTSTLHAEEVRLSAAASMTDLFRELIGTFAKVHPDVTVVTNFGSSGGLAKQIVLGAPADLYVSAAPKWMTYLLEEKMIEPSSTTVFASTSLVFVGGKDVHATSLADLPRLERIGIGTPQSVPAGQYAQQALTAAGLYDQLLQAGKLVMAKDVRQALIYADRGETSGSFVYKTDALLATQAVILFEVPQELYDTITYPLGLTVDGAAKPGAKAFYDFITSDAARAVIVRHGFSLPESH